MKKLLALALSLLLVVAAFAGCGAPKADVSSAPQQAASATIRIAGMKGPPTMGLASLLDRNSKGETHNEYVFSLKGAADEITPLLNKGELDIAAVPANLAATLYNKTEGKITLLAVNTLGVIYITERGETVKSVADLKGKTIFATGKGTTPEYSLRYILTKNGLDPDKDVKVEWFGEASEVVAKAAQTAGAVAMLPQPYVTVAGTKIADLRVALDLNAEWNKTETDSMMVTGVVIARTEFLKENKDADDAFLKEYKASIEFANENVAETATLIEGLGIIEKAAIAEKALPFCNLKFLDGAEMKTAVGGYLKVLYDNNPAAVGNKLPDDAFYYAK